MGMTGCVCCWFHPLSFCWSHCVSSLFCYLPVVDSQPLLLNGFGIFVAWSIHLWVYWSMLAALDYLSHITVFLWLRNMYVIASWKYLSKTLHFLNVMSHCHVLYFWCPDLSFWYFMPVPILCGLFFLLSIPNVWMLSFSAYHGHGRLSHWQLFLNLCFSMLYCTFTNLLHLSHCAL